MCHHNVPSGSELWCCLLVFELIMQSENWWEHSDKKTPFVDSFRKILKWARGLRLRPITQFLTSLRFWKGILIKLFTVVFLSQFFTFLHVNVIGKFIPLPFLSCHSPYFWNTSHSLPTSIVLCAITIMAPLTSSFSDSYIAHYLETGRKF